MRQLTADTVIKVRTSPRPARRRELTADTKIRLSQIMDLKDWVLEMAQDEAAPDGTIHHWSDGDHVKKNGKWVPVQNEPNHHKERQFASRYTSEPETSTFSKYLKDLYGEHPCQSVKSFIKKSGAVVYKKNKPVVTDSGKDIAPDITEGLNKLKELTGVTFDHVLFLDGSKGINPNTIAEVFPVDPFKNTLLVNKEHPFWSSDVSQKSVLMHSSTGLKEHVFLHEAGHKELARLPDTWDNEDDEVIASQLSMYAVRSPDEFQSELYTRKHAGLEVEEEIIELYERYGGDYASI